MERISILSWTNLNYDSDLSWLIDWIINEWVINWLVVSNTQVTAWRALVKVKRDATPDKEFYVLYETEDIVTIAPTNNQYIYIEVDQAKINDWSSNNVDWSWIWQIKVWASVPTDNCIILSQMNWSWVIITAERQEISLKNIPISWRWAHKLLFTDANWTVQELAFGTNWQVLWFTWPNTAPTPVSPTVDINSLTEETVFDSNDFTLIYDWASNKKEKLWTIKTNILESQNSDLSNAYTTNSVSRSNNPGTSSSASFQITKPQVISIALSLWYNTNESCSAAFQYSLNNIDWTTIDSISVSSAWWAWSSSYYYSYNAKKDIYIRWTVTTSNTSSASCNIKYQA